MKLALCRDHRDVGPGLGRESCGFVCDELLQEDTRAAAGKRYGGRTKEESDLS